MKSWIRNLAICSVLGSGALWGCNRNEGALTAVTGQAVIPDREVIAYIPQDTPYLWMGLEALPKALMDKSSALFRGDMQDAGFWDEVGRSGMFTPQVAQLLKELGSLLDASRLQEIGLSPDYRVTVYGLGLLPVVRVELQNEEKARAFLKRIEATGDPWPVKKLGDQAYFAFETSNVTMALAFVKNELVFAVVPAAMAEKLLKIAFLQEKPQNAFKDMSAFKALSRDYGLRYSMGYLDNRILGDMVMGRAQGINGEVAAALKLAQDLPEHCDQELSQLLAKMPRFVAGFGNGTSDNREVMKLGLELDPNSAKDLSSIANQGFGMGPKGKLLNLAVGLDLPKTAEYLKKQINAIQAAPFQCKYFSDINEASALLGGKLPLLMNPQWMDISAISAAVDAFDMKANASGSAMIAHAHPEKLLALLQGFGVPDLGLKPDGQMVDLQGKLPELPLPNLKPQARMTQNALGVAVGEGQNLAAFMDSKGEPGLILSLGYDAKLLEMAQQGFNRYIDASLRAARKAEMRRYIDETMAKGEGVPEEAVKERIGEEAFQKLKNAHPEMNPMQLYAESLMQEQAKETSSADPFIKALVEHVGLVQFGVKVTPKGVIGELAIDMK